MLPQYLRFDFRAHRDFFRRSRWISLPEAKDDARYKTLSFRVQKRSDRPEDTTTGLRWAVVVPKKVGNAVQRAKMKRLVRHAIIELFQEDADAFALSYNVVVFVRSPLESLKEARKNIHAFLSALHGSN